MRAAVVGAGVYGCAIATELAAAGHQVALHERHRDILLGASGANQGRLHRGFHYPRSQATALNAFTDADRFEARYGDCLDRSARRYYAVAEGSRTSLLDYLAFAESLGGRAVTPPPWMHGVDGCVAVDEPAIDVRRLRARLRRDLLQAGVDIRTNSPVIDPDRLDVDLVAWATYGRPWPWDRLRYEVCEVAVVELGQHLAGRGVVVMDGDFVSLDPLPGTGLHMLYDVVHSVHHTSVGAPEVPDHLVPVVDAGMVPTEHTAVDAMYATTRRFVGGMGMPRYVGSMFSVRAVLDGADATDARPTLIRRGRAATSGTPVAWVLAGKMDGAVAAAGQVAAAAAEIAGEPVPA